MSSFLQAIKKCESEFDKLTKKVLENEKAITQSLNNCSKNLVGLSNSVAKTQDSVGKTTDKTNAKIGKGVQDLEKKYKALEEQIKKTFAETKVNIPNANNNGRVGNVEGSISIKGLDGFVGRMFGIHSAVNTVKTYLKLQNDIAEKISSEVFNIGSHILDITGLKPEEMLSNAMDFEQIRETMNVLAKSEERGAEVYKNATDLAKYTAFTEKDTTAMANYILKANLMPNEEDLKQMGNLASLRPDLGAEHAGFSVFSWLNGSVTSLKRNFGLNNEMLRNYLKTLPDKKDFAKAFTKKGAVGDKEQAYNLLMRYIGDNYGNLALKHSRTLKGRFSTLEGMFQQFGANLIGLNNETGTITNENGVYARIGNFLGSLDENKKLSGFMKTLDDFTKSPVITEFQNIMGGFVGSFLDSLKQVITVPNLERFTGVVNRIGSSLKSLLDKANNMNVFEKIIDAVCSAGDTFADMLKRFSESASYEKFLDSLPDLIQQSLEYENAKLECAMTFSQYIPALTNLMDKTTEFIKNITAGQETIAQSGTVDDSEETRLQWNRLTGKVKNLKDGTDIEHLTDFNATRYLNTKAEEMGFTQEEKDRIINVVKTDNKDTYDINVTVAGGKIDEKKLEQEMQRVFVKLIDEADSNN